MGTTLSHLAFRLRHSVHAWLARVRGRSNDAALAALSTLIVSRSSTEALSSGSSILCTSWRAEELLQAIT